MPPRPAAFAVIPVPGAGGGCGSCSGESGYGARRRNSEVRPDDATPPLRPTRRRWAAAPAGGMARRPGGAALSGILRPGHGDRDHLERALPRRAGALGPDARGEPRRLSVARGADTGAGAGLSPRDLEGPDQPRGRLRLLHHRRGERRARHRAPPARADDRRFRTLALRSRDVARARLLQLRGPDLPQHRARRQRGARRLAQRHRRHRVAGDPRCAGGADVRRVRAFGLRARPHALGDRARALRDLHHALRVSDLLLRHRARTTSRRCSGW